MATATVAPCPECGRAADDIELDATDFAHPAWWRGSDHAALAMSSQLAHALGMPLDHDWQSMLSAVRVMKMAAKAGLSTREFARRINEY